MRRLAVTIALVLATASPAIAQGQASISGMVKDASGAVMPGVNVEASSPALIEKVRTVVTDTAGVFAIVDLRPGTYTVTFTLPGFTTIKREGIELSGAFNAEVNADLRVGGLEETITVSGASPVVDVKSTLSQSVLTKDQLEALPGGRSLKGRAALIPGVIVPSANTGVVSHGSDSNDSNYMTDGYKSGQHLVGRGTGNLGVGSTTQTQEAAIEELVYDTGGQGAEFASSGVRMNMIPKEGGNRFRAEGIVVRQQQALRVEQHHAGARGAGPPLRLPAVCVRLQSDGGRPDQEGQAVVLRFVLGQREQRGGAGHLLQAERAVDAGPNAAIARSTTPASGARRRPAPTSTPRSRSASRISSRRSTSCATASKTRNMSTCAATSRPAARRFRRKRPGTSPLSDLRCAGEIHGSADEPAADRGGSVVSNAATSSSISNRPIRPRTSPNGIWARVGSMRTST